MISPVYKTQEEFGRFIALHFAKQDIPDICTEHGLLTLTVLRAALLRVMRFLRDDPSCRFSQLTDIVCAENEKSAGQFEIRYLLLSPIMEKRMCLTLTTETDVPVSSAVSVFENAGWYEREIREMFGVWFDDHPDLRRLLTDDDLVGCPLRKSFPAAGEYDVRYDDSKESCVSVKKRKTSGVTAFGIDLNREQS